MRPSLPSMPRPIDERPSRAVQEMPSAVYSPVAHRLAEHTGPVFPLHVGDTWMTPFEGGRMEDLDEAEFPGLHRYCPTDGLPELLEALLEKVRRRNHPCEPGQVLVTSGATSGLSCTVSAIADPGEEILILAPFWPLIRGIVISHRATPVEVPFYDRAFTPDEAIAAVEAARSERCVALYFSSPSNPSGRVLAPDVVEALAGWARSHDLWILSDEVYEDYVHRGEHVSTARFAPERTVSVYSFSKAYGMAGNRAGYLVAPPALREPIHKVSVHSAYHAPTAAQRAGLRALQGGADWVAHAAKQYASTGARVAEILGAPAPEGSCFLFLDASRALDARGMTGLLEDLLERGVLVAPGASAGGAYESWIRLCYTVVPPDDAVEAAQRLAERLGRG